MELNGIANLVHKIQFLALDGKISQEIANELCEDAFAFVAYVRAFEEDPTLLWHEFRASLRGNKERNVI